jgi:serralysin
MSRNSGDAAGDSYAGIAAVGGSGYHDYLVGDAGANLLNGDAGADTLIGGAGADALTGGTGDDTYYVDDAGDNVVETSASGGNDIVYSSVSYDLHGRYVETLSLRGTGNIDATGNGQANTLIGNGGKNVLDGMAGNDTLTGGAGADTFVFDTALSGTTNVDTITDFTIGQDLIQLDLSVFKKAGVAGGLGAGAFTIGSAATTTAQRIIYDAGTGDLFYDADGSGSGAQVQFATLAKNLALTAGSFSLHG